MKKAKQIDIDAVSAGPELDALVAEWVLGWMLGQGGENIKGWEWDTTGDALVPVYWWLDGDVQKWLHEFSTDANHVREVEAEIERRGLVDQYVSALVGAVKQPVLEFEETKINSWFFTQGELFLLIHATPEQRCRAAYRAVMGAHNEES